MTMPLMLTTRHSCLCALRCSFSARANVATAQALCGSRRIQSVARRSLHIISRPAVSPSNLSLSNSWRIRQHGPRNPFVFCATCFSSATRQQGNPVPPAHKFERNQDGVLISPDTGLPWLGKTEDIEMPESLPRIERTLQERKNAIAALDEYLVRMEAKLVPTMEHLEMVEDVIDRLERNVMTYLRTITPVLDVYGSYLSGLYTPGSDLDLTLTGNTGTLRPHDVEVMLRYYRYKSVRSLKHMKEYVVQFIDPVTNLQCDLCLNQHLAIQNSLMLGTYVTMDPRVRRIVYALKQMVRHLEIDGARKGHISNYAYTLWVIAFLQMQNPPVLLKLQPPPPLPSSPLSEEESNSPSTSQQQFQNRENMTVQVNGRTLDRVFIEGHDCTFDRNPPRLNPATASNVNSATAGELLLGFLERFGYDHDYVNFDIHTRTATVEPRVLGTDGMASVASRRLGRFASPRLRLFDPFLVHRDLGAGARIGGAMRIRESFQWATNAILEHRFEDVFGDVLANTDTR